MALSLYHDDPAVSVEEGGSVVFLHERQQEALAGFVGTPAWHFDAAQHLAAVAVLAPAVEGEQRDEGSHLKDKIQEDRHSSVQSKGLHCRHGRQGTWEDGTNTSTFSKKKKKKLLSLKLEQN